MNRLRIFFVGFMCTYLTMEVYAAAHTTLHYFGSPEEALAALRGHEDRRLSSEDGIIAVLKYREEIRDLLLEELSANWKQTYSNLSASANQNVNPNQAFITGLLAKYLIEFYAAGSAKKIAARNAARNAARKTKNSSGHAAWLSANKAADDTLYTTAWKAASNAATNTTWRTAFNAAGHALGNTALSAAVDAVQRQVSTKLEFLKGKGPDDLGIIASNLSELFTLIWLVNESGTYIKTAFDAACSLVPADMTIKAAKSIIYQAIKYELEKDNPYIMAFARDLRITVKIP